MPTYYKSDKATYSYPDDVPEDVVWKDIAEVERQPSTMEVISAVPGGMKRGLMAPVIGGAKLIEDATGMDLGSEYARKGFQMEAQAETPRNMDVFQEGVYSGLSSLPSSLAAGVAMLATRNPTLGLGIMGAQAGLAEYPEQRDAGMGVGRSLLHSGVAGGAEVAGEWGPMKILSNYGGGAFKSFLRQYVGADIGGELLTQAVQSANEKLSRNPNMTWEEFARDMAVTVIGAGVGSAVQAPVFAGGVAAVEGGKRALAAGKVKLGDLLDRWTEIKPVAEAMGEFTSPDNPLHKFNPVPDDFVSPDPVVPVEQAWVVQQVEDAVVNNDPMDATLRIIYNSDGISAAKVDVPAVVGELVSAGKITTEKATEVLSQLNKAVTARIDSADKAVVKAHERYLLQAGLYTPKVNQQDMAAGTGFERDAQAVDAIMQEVSAGTLDVTATAALGPALAQLGISPTITSEILNTPATERQYKLERLQNYLSMMRTWDKSEPHMDFTKYSVKQEGFGSEIRGKVVTFGHAKGQTVDSGLTSRKGEVNIVNEEGGVISEKDVRRVFAVVNTWRKKFLPGMQIVAHIRPPVPNANGTTTLGHMRMINERQVNGELRVVGLEIATTFSRGTADGLSTLAHEFGHAMFVKYFQEASPQMKEALWQMYRKDIFGGWDMKLGDFMKSQRGELAKQSYPSRHSVGVELMLAQMRGNAMTNDTVNYHLNFFEWHAHMMERMFLNDYKGMASDVKTFWRRAYALLEKFFGFAHNQWDPTQEIGEWLRISTEYEVARSKAMKGAMEVRERAQEMGFTSQVPVQMPDETAAMGGDQLPNAVPDGRGESGIISMANNPLSSILPTPDFTAQLQQWNNVARNASPQHGTPVIKALANFNKRLAYFKGSFQVLKQNLDVPGVKAFLAGLRNKMMYKSVWLRESTQISHEWEKLGKVRAGKLAKILLDEAETGTWYSSPQPDPNEPGREIYILDPVQANAFGIDDQTGALYSRIRSMFAHALNEMEALGRARIQRQFADDPSNPQMQAQLDDLQLNYANMRVAPYTPFSRFGQYYIRVKAKEYGSMKNSHGVTKFYTPGQTVYFETFDTAKDRDKAMDRVRKDVPDTPLFKGAMTVGMMNDNVYSMRNVPPQFFNMIATRLGLTETQREEYQDILKDLAVDTSFVKHLKHKSNIAGYSPDVLRGFSDYFMRFANMYAKEKVSPELDAAMGVMRTFKKDSEERAAVNGETINTDTFDQLYGWIERTKDYVMKPGSELGELKSFVAAWYLGFNVVSAVQNSTQIPFVTLPYLAKRFGWGKAVNTMRKATKDAIMGWHNPQLLAQHEQDMISYALDSGFLDESLPTSIAQFAEGTALSRVSPTAYRHRLLNWYNHKAMFMFQKMEELNRRTTLLATYRLNLPDGYNGPFNVAAFDAARASVEETQNEYAMENRPEFMRGNKSVVFQFMHYQQFMIFTMFGGDKAWKEILLMQLAVGGMLGLPFMEDILNAGKFLARKFGMHFEPKLEMAKLLAEIDIAPDWVLKGAAGHLGPFDLSGRYSLGRVIPGMDMIASNKDFAQAVTEGVGDVGGAGASIVLGGLKAMSNLDDPDTLKTFSYTAPAAVRYVINAIRAEEHGGVYASDQAVLAELTPVENAGMLIGLTPAKSSKVWGNAGFQMEMKAYWETRRNSVLENYTYAVMVDDREGIADTMARISKFNEDVVKVEPAMIIKGKTLRQSIRGRYEKKARHEALGTPDRYLGIARESQVDPEGIDLGEDE